MEEIIALVNAFNKAWPKGDEPFQIITRLAEECGELAQQVNHWEGSGLKRQKHGEPSREHLAKEVWDVIRCALQVAIYYGVEPDLEAAINMQLILVRHGHYLGNQMTYPSSMSPEEIDALGLTETGHSQACALAERLKKLTVNRIYSSPLQRAMETAYHLAQGREVLVVSHGNFISTFVSSLLGLAPCGYGRFAIENCACLVVDWPAQDRPRLRFSA